MEADLTMELREWYMNAAEQFGWSKSELIAGIDSSAHESMILNAREEVFPFVENGYENDTSKDVKSFNRIAAKWVLEFIKTIIAFWRNDCRDGFCYINIREIAVMRC